MENNQEGKIQEGEIRSAEEESTIEKKVTSKNKLKKSKVEFYIELILFFVLGVLLGVVIKTEARKKITIGFDDYKMRIKKQDYNINQMQNDLIQEQIQKANQKAETQALNKQNKVTK
jgi:hypothetical protein